MKKLRRQRTTHINARAILNQIAGTIQQQFKNKIETLITYAIQAVYNRPFTFELLFQTKRNIPTITPVIKERGETLCPKDDDLGGGLLDTIAFPFRFILQYLEEPRSRNVFFLDEPFKFLGSLTPKAGSMLKYLSKKFSLQIILVTHDKELMKICDKVYTVEHDGTESKIKRKIKRRD